MCTLGDDEVMFLEKELPLDNINDVNCKKCTTEKAALVLRKKDPYCNKCFLDNVVHKFRASLGKTKLIRPGNKVLIAYTGDDASSALVHLVKTGLDEATHKKLRFVPISIYIDEGAIYQETIDERIKKTTDIIQLAQDQSSQIHLYIASLSDVLILNQGDLQQKQSLQICENLDSQLRKLFTSTSSLTAKQDLLKKLRQKLLINYAKLLNCPFILVADTATKLAADLLANLSLGGGPRLSSEVGFCDARDEFIKILRPMRDYTSDDLRLFIKTNNISYINHKSLTSYENPYESIQSLTKKFVNDLQDNFPATIPTVLRTGDKLDTKSEATYTEDNTCAICQSLLDTQPTQCSALQATEFSREMSTNNSTVEKQKCLEASGECCGRSCEAPERQALSREQVEHCLCYSCRLLVRDIGDLQALPSALVTSIKLKHSLQNIRNDIQEYLL